MPFAISCEGTFIITAFEVTATIIKITVQWSKLDFEPGTLNETFISLVFCEVSLAQLHCETLMFFPFSDFLIALGLFLLSRDTNVSSDTH